MTEKASKNKMSNNTKNGINVGTKIILQVSVLVVLICFVFSVVLYFGAKNSDLNNFKIEIIITTIILIFIGLSYRISINNRDEFGTIAEALNRAAQNMGEVIAVVKK